jgi:hypothetical protein
VVNFFASLDAKIDCDVLDDFWGEVSSTIDLPSTSKVKDNIVHNAI